MAPTFRHGKTAVIFFATAGSTTGAIRMSSGFNDASLDRSVETAEVTTFGDSDKRYLAGLRDAKGAWKGNFSSTHAKKFDAMLGNSTGGYLIYSPESTATGRRKYKGAVIIDSLKYGASVGDKVSAEVSFQWTGAITSTNW
jgi:hypothetical protein